MPGTHTHTTHPRRSSVGRAPLSSLEHRKADGSLLGRYEYTRDASARVTQQNQPGDHTTSFGYDEVYHPLSESRTGTAPYSNSYTFDATGNRLTKTSGGAPETCTYGDNNQILKREQDIKENPKRLPAGTRAAGPHR